MVGRRCTLDEVVRGRDPRGKSAEDDHHELVLGGLDMSVVGTQTQGKLEHVAAVAQVSYCSFV